MFISRKEWLRMIQDYHDLKFDLHNLKNRVEFQNRVSVDDLSLLFELARELGYRRVDPETNPKPRWEKIEKDGE